MTKVDYPLLQIYILKCKKPQTAVKTFITKIITEIFFIFWTFFDHLKENFLGGIYDHTNEGSEKQLQQFSPDDGARNEGERVCACERE